MMTAPDGTHIVVELTSGDKLGQAQKLGLCAGDIILGLNEELLVEHPMNHNELLWALKSTPRPFTMQVGRAIARSSQCVTSEKDQAELLREFINGTLLKNQQRGRENRHAMTYTELINFAKTIVAAKGISDAHLFMVN